MQGSRRKTSTKSPFARFVFPLRSLRYNILAPLFFNAKVVRRLDSQRAREVVKKELVGTASGCLSIQTATRSRTSSGTCPRRMRARPTGLAPAASKRPSAASTKGVEGRNRARTRRRASDVAQVRGLGLRRRGRLLQQRRDLRVPGHPAGGDEHLHETAEGAHAPRVAE